MLRPTPIVISMTRAALRSASATPPRGGKSRGAPSEIADLKNQLKDLADGVLSSKIERADAVVVNQILNTRARLIELERKVRETDQLEARLEALESVLKRRNTA